MLPGRRIALLLLLECSARARGANGIYGGEADKPHLGGFVDVSVQGGFDRDGLSPRLWRYMLSNWTVHSVIDVGCGRGATSLWFHLQDARVRCVEGSSEAVRQSLLPRSIITQHDFTAGPYIPDETYDMAWSVEFLEHVRSDKMNNYIATLRKARAPTGYRPGPHPIPRAAAHMRTWRMQAALVVVSASIWGGYHHVEVHPQSWWIRKLETLGFRYSASLTADVRSRRDLGAISARGPRGLTHRLLRVCPSGEARGARGRAGLPAPPPPRPRPQEG